MWHLDSICFLNVPICVAKNTLGNEETEAREQCVLLIDILRNLLRFCQQGTRDGL